MSLFSALKKNAKMALKGRWGIAIGVYMLPAAVSALLSGLEHTALHLFVMQPLLQNPTMESEAFDLAELTRELLTAGGLETLISFLFMLLTFLLLSPLRLGLIRWYFALIHGTAAPFGEVFYFFESMRRYLRALWYNVQISLRTALWSIAFFVLPSGVLGVSLWLLSTEGISQPTHSSASVGLVLAVALFLLFAAWYAIFLNRYALTAYLLCESDHITVREAFQASIRYTKGHRTLLLLFALSFLGWYLLAPLTLFLLLLFVIPYYSAGHMLLCRYLVEKNRFDQPDTTQEWHPVR